MNVFISFSSANEWLTHDLKRLIEEVNPDANVFCTSEPMIRPGDNYKKKIYEKLMSADVFVAVLSMEYWESRYCVMELGGAYERFRKGGTPEIAIKPLLLPPLDKGHALANTPLMEMQVVDITDADDIASFLRCFATVEHPWNADRMSVLISEYASMVRSTTLKQASLLDGSEIGAYFDEPAGSAAPKDRIVRCGRTGAGRILFEFNLSRLEQIGHRPSFASVAMQFPDELNLRDYLRVDENASFRFRIDNVGAALRSVTVEFKYDSNLRILRAFERSIHEGANVVTIPLREMDHKPLSEIREICFVVRPESMSSPDGLVLIDGIGVDFSRRNVLEEA